MTPDPSQRPASAMSVAMSVERLGFDLGELVSERPKKSRWRDSGVAKKRNESLRPVRGEPARADEGAPMGSVVASTTPPSRASSILPRPPRVPPAVLLGVGAVVLALLLAAVVARNTRQDPITEPLPLAEGHSGDTRPPPAAAKSAAAGAPSPAVEVSSADGSLPLAARPDAGLSRAGKVESPAGARAVTPRVAPDAAVRVTARVDPGAPAKTAPVAKGPADAGLTGADALFAELDAQLGKALAARGLNWDDLETADPVRTRQWGRWYRKAEVPTEQALREMYRSLAEGIDRAARQVGGTARSVPTSTVAN